MSDASVDQLLKPRRAPPLSKNMEYILQQEALTKGIDPTLLRDNDFSHVIIKEVQEDERMYLVTMVKRLMHCCPYYPEQDEVKPPTQPDETFSAAP